MSDWNSIPGYGPADPSQLQEAAGVTQFNSDTGWYQVTNGLLIQGAKVAVGANTSLVVPFLAAFPQQLLGIFMQPIVAGVGNGYGAVDPAGTDLTQFTLVNTGAAKSYYWWAIGV